MVYDTHNKHNIADVMGVSEVLLCPYHLKDIMVNSKNSKFNTI